jgi:hypothetical protein
MAIVKETGSSRDESEGEVGEREENPGLSFPHPLPDRV